MGLVQEIRLKTPQKLCATRCWLPERFASAWSDLIIAFDVRGRGEWLHRCPLQLACVAYRLFARAFHALRLQTDRRTDITSVLRNASFAFTVGGHQKIDKTNDGRFLFVEQNPGQMHTHTRILAETTKTQRAQAVTQFKFYWKQTAHYTVVTLNSA